MGIAGKIESRNAVSGCASTGTTWNAVATVVVTSVDFAISARHPIMCPTEMVD